MSIAIAPLMGYTDPYFCRLMHWIAPDFQLYSEMYHANSVIFGDKHKRFGDLTPYVNLQLGGSNPDELGEAASMCADLGFASINFNLGCPSPKVQKGAFGACLMKNKVLVADCVSAMQAQSTIPVTIKCRVGVDEFDSDAYFFEFMAALSEVGCLDWVVHARIALLEGLSTKENREVPPLQYSRVWQLKQLFPHARITINGGINTPVDVSTQLQKVDGVMIGRWAIASPWDMRSLQEQHFPDNKSLLSRTGLIEKYLSFIRQEQEDKDFSLSYKIRHLSSLYSGERHARRWRSMIANSQTIEDVMLV